MPIFIKILESERKKLFYTARDASGISFNNLPKTLKISRTMFYNYLRGNYYIPEKIFGKLMMLSNLNNVKHERIIRSKYSKKNLIKPILGGSLSEIIGILNGDGHISKYNYEICVVISNLEENYFSYLKNLFEKTLKLRFSRYNRGTYLKLRVNSKELSNFFREEYNLPIGNKLGKLKIPLKIKNSKNLLISYLRGLYDTDGSFYIRRKKEPVIQITNADSKYISEVRDSLISLGFKVSKGNKRIFIYDKDHVENFFKIIKPSNTKHLKKYQDYLKNNALVV